MKFSDILMYALSTALCLLIVESGYRVYLSTKLHYEFDQRKAEIADLSYGVHGIPAPWRYSETNGFDFNDHEWVSAVIENGEFSHCGYSQFINRFGNVGRADGFESADIRVMLFGSSYTMGPDEQNEQVTDNLAARLSERLGKNVSVMNYSRDATGLLSAFDIADVAIKEFDADLLIFTFNTTGLFYRRHWRVLTEDPEEPSIKRLVFSLENTPNPTNPETMVINAILATEDVSRAWCERMDAPDEQPEDVRKADAQVVARLNDAYQRVQADINLPEIVLDFYRLDLSFVWNRIFHANALYNLQIYEQDRPINAPLTIDSYEKDETFVKRVAALRDSGVPMMLVHIPTLPEMETFTPGDFLYGQFGPPENVERGLEESLERLTGEEIIHLFKYYPDGDKANPESLVNTRKDWHPSKRGTELIAKTLEELIIERQYLN